MAAATPVDAEIDIVPGVDPLESTKTSLPFTAKSALSEIWKRRAVGAPSRTREIKSETA